MESKAKLLACQTIDERSSDLHEISKKIWENPELGYEEYAAHELLTSFLEKEGFSVLKKTPLETSFIARFGNPGGLKVGVICEYDALPGIGHACGHNLIAEAGIGAALGIKEVLQQQAIKCGQIIVYGTPAEEGGGGKIKMLEKGTFDETDFCMMSHPSSFEVPDPICLAMAEINIVFLGKPAHAAAAPWEGINALDAAITCYNSVSMLRQQIPPDCRIHCIIADGGKRPNIIPERSEMIFYIRHVENKGIFGLKEKVMNCAKGAAKSTGCDVQFLDDPSRSYASVKTNTRLIQLYIENARSIGVEFGDEMTMKRGSTDMGNVSHIKPSIHPFFKINCDGPSHAPVFAKAAGLVESQMPTLKSAKSMAMTAIDILCTPGLINEVKNDFMKK